MWYTTNATIHNFKYISTIYIPQNSAECAYISPNKGTASSASVPGVPYTTTLAAIIHAHAAYDPKYKSEEFSGTAVGNGRGDTDAADALGVPIYVTTPSGTLLKYDPNNSVVSVIGKGFPRDPNSPV